MRLAWLVAILGCVQPVSPHPSARDPEALHVAVWAGDRATVARLLADGADPNALDHQKVPAWVYAEVAQDAPMLDLLMQKPLAATEDMRLGFAMAVSRNDVALVTKLLAHHAPLAGKPGTTTALMVAAANGLPDMVALLLDHGADPSARDSDGNTAATAARLAGCDACLARLPDAAVASPAPSGATSVRDAVDRSVPLVVREGAHWVDEPGCQSCHHQPMAIQVIARAEQRGIAIDRAQAAKVREFLRDDAETFRKQAGVALANDDTVVRRSMDNAGDLVAANAWVLSAELDAGTPRGPAEEVAAAFQARLQLADGHWRHGLHRGVMQSSDLVTTALAAHVLAAYAPGPDIAERVARARRWLIAARPSTTVEVVYRLNGLAWTHAEPTLVVAAAAELLARQQADGSWAYVGSIGDAYTTAVALVALHRSGGLAVTDPVYARGIRYLLATQHADGSWFVPSRAAPLQPYFESGAPHGRHQFISFAATAWATLALTE